MSSFATSSPVSASTFRYLMRWPVARFSWLNEIFSLSEVAGYSATGQVTSDRRRKPFQFARGAMNAELQVRVPRFKTNGTHRFRHQVCAGAEKKWSGPRRAAGPPAARPERAKEIRK